MTMIKNIVLLATFLLPAAGCAHDYHDDNRSRHQRWQPDIFQESEYDYRDYDQDQWRSPRHERRRPQSHKQKRKFRNRVQAGWDVDPGIARNSSNCYRYTLISEGGRGSARIMSIPGDNVIQVTGQKSGYVCFQNNTSLELGKLGNPDIKVIFTLDGNGKYRFGRGQTGSDYKNSWYRSYWGL